MDRNRLFWTLATCACAAFVLWSAHQWGAAIDSCEALFLPISGDEQAASESAGRIFLDNDAYYWVGYAREMVETGVWRIRYTHFDNPPDGRAVHWSQSVSWLLVLTGAIRHLFTGETMHVAIEHAAIWIGPLQYILLMAGTGLLLLRRLGALPSLIWMGNLMLLPSISWSFHPMRPDHHGLHIGFLMASLLCLILGGLGWTVSRSEATERVSGWFRALELPDKRHARRYFIASGILGGLGLWTGASVQLFGIGLFAAGALLLVLFMPAHFTEGGGESPVYEPALWRWWAMAGSGTALLFYLIEYAPDFPGLRLEVNHPLYAVSWLCVGEVLVRLSASKTRGRRAILWVTGVFLFGAALLPALLIFGSPDWHAMRDPLMQRLHEFIDEFRPYRTAYSGAILLNLFKDFGLLPLFLVAAPFLARDERTRLHEWAALWMAFVSAAVYAALTFWQVRWNNFFAASGLFLAVLVLAVLWRLQKSKGRLEPWYYVLVALVAGQSIYFFNQHVQDIFRRDFSREQVGALLAPMMQRQFAEKLGALNTNDSYRLMSAPNLAARLYYYGQLPSVTSYYWENLDGLRAAAEFFATADNEAALRIVRERGITHVVFPPTPGIVRMFCYVWRGYHSEAAAHASLAGRMLTGSAALPPWIQRDPALERQLQPGYLFDGQPVFGTLLVFTVEADAM